MSVLAGLSAAGEIIAGPIKKLGERLVGLIPDKEAAAKWQQELDMAVIQMASKIDEAQAEINKIEAQSGSLFVAGWRPFIGWVCASALAYQFVLSPILVWAVALSGRIVPPPPILDGMLWELVLTMLGMGGLRTFEKFHGVARANKFR